jgi:hypothetical protein
MTTDEVIRVIRANIGKKVRATPFPPATTPFILLVGSVGEEGFIGYDFSDPNLVDPSVPGHTPFCDVSEVEPVEDSK